ncbi:protein rep, partial [Staphylococcus hominis]
MCGWGKGRKDGLGLWLMMEYIKETEDKQFIFLTLTTPNVTTHHLQNQIKIYNKSFNKIFQPKK